MTHIVFDLLPRDVLYRILSYLRADDICQLRQVNRTLQDLTYDRHVWTASYRDTCLPLPEVPITSVPTEDLELSLCRATALDKAFDQVSLKPIIRRKITERDIDPWEVDDIRLNLVGGRWLVSGRQNVVRCYDLDTPDPSSENPVTWTAMSGVQMHAYACHICLDDNAILYAYLGTQDAITVLKLSLNPRPTAFKCIRRLKWVCDNIYDNLEGTLKTINLNDRFLLACEYGRDNGSATLFELYARTVHNVPFPQTSLGGRAHSTTFLTSTYLWCFHVVWDQPELNKGPFFVEVFTLPPRNATTMSSFLSATPARISWLRYSHISEHTNELTSGMFSLLHTTSPPVTPAHTLRVISHSWEVFELTLTDSVIRGSPGTVLIQKLWSLPDPLRQLPLPWLPTVVYSARGTYIMVSAERQSGRVAIWRLCQHNPGDAFVLDHVPLPLPEHTSSYVRGDIVFDVAAGRLCANITLPKLGVDEPYAVIHVYDLVSCSRRLGLHQ